MIDGRVLGLGYFNRKNNLGRPHAPVGMTVDFDGDRVKFSPAEIATIAELAESLPLWQRLRSALQSGPPRTLAALAEELGAEVDSVDKTVRRKPGLFTKVSGDDGIRRIALVERRAS